MLNLNYLSRVFVLTTDMCKQWRRNYEHTTALLLFFRSYSMNAMLWYTFPASHRCIHHHVSGLLILFHFQVFSLRDKEEMEKKAEFWSLMFFAVGVTSFFSNLISVKRSSFSLSLIQPLFSTSFSECDFSENTNTVSWIIWQISLFRARCFPSLENLWLYDWERRLLKRFLNRSVNRTNKGQVDLDNTWKIFFPSSFSWSTVSFLVYAPYFLLKGFSSLKRARTQEYRKFVGYLTESSVYKSYYQFQAHLPCYYSTGNIVLWWSAAQYWGIDHSIGDTCLGCSRGNSVIFMNSFHWWTRTTWHCR